MHPVVLHAQIGKRIGQDGGVVRVPKGRDGGGGTIAPVQAQAVGLACERVALQPVVQSVHEHDEKQRGKRVTLTQTALHLEWFRDAIGSAHARREAAEAVRDELDKAGGMRSLCMARVRTGDSTES